MDYRLRKATLDDQPALTALIARSARELSREEYRPEVVEGALRGAFGVDSQLIRDGTYFVVESAEGALVGCGGWSYRRTLFGSDSGPGRDASKLDPSVDAAKIRAFFIDPAHARRGLGTLLLNHCESEAAARGFTRFEMMATLPGQKLYAARGYAAIGHVTHELAAGLTIEFVPMRKELPVMPPANSATAT
jgi:GNAT superfamily N-acetyltransferase